MIYENFIETILIGPDVRSTDQECDKYLTESEITRSFNADESPKTFSMILHNESMP